jgi:hypothetical protein
VSFEVVSRPESVVVVLPFEEVIVVVVEVLAGLTRDVGVDPTVETDTGIAADDVGVVTFVAAAGTVVVVVDTVAASKAEDPADGIACDQPEQSLEVGHVQPDLISEEA